MKSETRYMLGRRLDEAGRYDEAESAYREAIAEGDPRSPIALGILLTKRGRTDDRQEAEALFRRELEVGHEHARLNYANLLAKWPGREVEAEEMYRQCLQAGETDAHHNFAVMLQQLGRYEEAEVQFRKGGAAGDPWAWEGLGALLQEAERWEEAEEAFATAIQSGHREAHGSLGGLYWELDRLEDAEREFQTAVAAGYPNYQLNLGELYEDLERFGDAEEQYRAAIAQGNADARILLGNLLDDLLRPGEAEEQYRLALEAGEKVPSATFNLAICLEGQGREEEAMAAYRAAADLGFGPAQWRLAQLGRERDPGYEGLDVWVGLVHVKPMPGNDVLEGGLGAFASPYALGRNATAYRVTVEKHFGEMGLEVQEVEDVELFTERVWRRDPPLEAFELAARVSLSTPVVWDSLNVYMSEDEE